ncbi:MAG: hypothetical protein A3G92_03295 [Deltaproteobacteria bacterium RIFCSPLOWO2_12_FULL_38_8]|nr:MAG: hypothetical protein A3G92_03295 [Deltaproteobacteria bacterium RIFCSPLOWO2_12_FULL_38_8]
MSSFSDWYMYLVVAVIFIAFFIVVRRKEKKRTEALSQWARSRGYSFLEQDSNMVGAQFTRYLELFNCGRSIKFRNVIRATIEGKESQFFDYEYVTGSGKHSTTHCQTVAAFSLVSTMFPEFTLSPESFFHKIGSLVGYDDIDFPEDEMFSKTCFLRAKDMNAVKNIFNPQVRSALLLNKGWSIESGAHWLIVYKADDRINVEDFSDFVQETTHLFHLFE